MIGYLHSLLRAASKRGAASTEAGLAKIVASAGQGLDIDGLVESPERQCKELTLQTTLGWAEFCSKGKERRRRGGRLSEPVPSVMSSGTDQPWCAAAHATAQYGAALHFAEDQLKSRPGAQ